MLLDAGIVGIYEQTLTSAAGAMPAASWSLIWQSYYGNKTVGINRYYTAMANNDRIDMLIEVNPNTNISPAAHRAKIGDVWYKIAQVQQIIVDGLPMTDLALERIGVENDA